MNVLSRIVEHKRAELARAEARLPAAILRQLLKEAPPLRGFRRALESGPAPRIIAEVKRASPSKGVLKPDLLPTAWQPEALARAYEVGGARALSVLTDVAFFWGSPDALIACRAATQLPVLRKDFLVSSYQVDESRWLGADAVLLIVRILDDATLKACAARAFELGMDVLVEIHDDNELERALAVPGAIIGINHRNLDTMAMDADRAVRLRPRISSDRLVVAESGLRNRADLARLVAAGIDTFLIGESLARDDDPAAALKALTS